MWNFLDGYTSLAWLRTSRPARKNEGWLAKVRKAKESFKEVGDYLQSGKLILLGLTQGKTASKFSSCRSTPTTVT